MPNTKQVIRTKLSRALPYIILIGSIIGLIASFILSLDEIRIAANPNYIPSCNLNPVVSCGNVMKSAQAHAFGFPNPFIGLAGFAVLITIAVAILAGAKLKRWFWIGLEIGMLLGMAFTYWLLVESIYRIKALCPYCLIVDVVITIMFWYITLYNLETGSVRFPHRLIGIGDFMRRHHFDILAVWFVVVIAVILQHFWYYYGTLL